jgi:tRNA pseudouridine38-40 synthase
MPEASFFAVLQYAGQGFAGWQRQATDRTVQGELERMLEQLMGTRIATNAAGRTDAGVHALGQVVSFRVPERWEPRALLRALRAVAPDDLWVARVGSAPDGFHARTQALSRRYRYVVGCDPDARSPFRRPFEWALGASLDPSPLAAAAQALVGEHDFRAFAAAGPSKPDHRCRVTVAEWQARSNQEGFIFTVEADRFLRRMVRFLVGTMVDIGRRRRPVDDMARLLGRPDNRETSPPAPPEGLFFVGARYRHLDEGYDR